jgi:uncharacterized protein (DUF1697 family)
MTYWVGLLRAVNLGSHGKIAMADLRQLLSGLGFEDVRTIVQTGNAIFEAARKAEEIETEIEAALAEKLGLKTPVIVRTASQWRALVKANPYPEAAREDPAHLLLMALKGPPKPGGLDDLRAAIKGRETAEVNGREAYLTYPDGIGTSKLTSAVIERKLGATGTARNWNTVLKIGAALGG